MKVTAEGPRRSDKCPYYIWYSACSERKKTLKSVSGNSTLNSSFIDINQGDIIIHNRFGKGQVISTEGSGGDKKAEVLFKTSGTKKILLKFAKYEKITS